MKNLNINYILWLLPFISFGLGYILFEYMFAEKQIFAPQVVGKTLNEAVKTLSDHKINARILAEKEDADLPEGIILEQKPNQTWIKPYQSIYLIISKKPEQELAPNIIDKNLTDVKKELNNKKIKYRTYYIDSLMPKNTILHQIPNPHEPIKNKIDLFLSSGESTLFIMPNLKNRSLNEVEEFLKLNNIKYNINQQSNSKKITGQQPLPGSIIDLNNLVIQIKI